MFTGIVEEVGKVVALKEEGDNLHLTIQASFVPEIKIDQSIAHNGVCLTVVAINDDRYVVTAIKETLDKTALGDLTEGAPVNLERCMKLSDRLDGHIMQGHVDQVAICTARKEEEGSWVFTFEYAPEQGNITVEKGSICVNGISLTVVNSHTNSFSVAIIPYTYEHTNFHALQVGHRVNLEFDVIGKYVARLLER